MKFFKYFFREHHLRSDEHTLSLLTLAREICPAKSYIMPAQCRKPQILSRYYSVD